MRILLTSIFFLSLLSLIAQQDITLVIDVSADTIFMDNAFRIQYICKNGTMDSFRNQELEDFDLLQGPSRSSQMSIINGVRSGEETYTYYYRPQKAGKFKIKGFEISIDGNVYKSDPVAIVVVENPVGLHQDPNNGRVEGRPIKKSARKRYRI